MRKKFDLALKAVPLELKQANEFVDKLHRHHDSVHRDKFRIGCEMNGKLVGVVQLARPVRINVRVCHNSGEKLLCCIVGHTDHLL